MHINVDHQLIKQLCFIYVIAHPLILFDYYSTIIDYYSHKAFLLLKLKRFKEAIIFSDKGIELDPNITVYFYIDNKLKTNFYHSEISLNDSINVNSNNFLFDYVKKIICGGFKNRNKNENKSFKYMNKKRLKGLIFDFLNLTFTYLDILKNKGDIRDENLKRIFYKFLHYIILHKFFCKNSKKQLNERFCNKNNIKNFYQDNNEEDNENNFQENTSNHNNSDNFLHIKFAKIYTQEQENNQNDDFEFCEICEENIIVNNEKILNLSNMNTTEIKILLDKFFNYFSEKLYSKFKGKLYFELFRINLYYINCYSNKVNKKVNELKILYDLQRNLFKLNNKKIPKNYMLYYYHYQKITSIRKFEFHNDNHSKLINYYELSHEFISICEELKKNLCFFKERLNIELVISFSNNINLLKENIKKLIGETNLDSNIEPNEGFYINFHYIYIFNSFSKKLNIREINIDLIDSIEENFEKNNNLFFEYCPYMSNIIFKSINPELLKELKYNFGDLKEEYISKIFPYFITKKQLNKILFCLENESKENFTLKLLVNDSDKNIKYLEFTFKKMIGLNIKVFLFAKYKNIDYLEGEIKSENIYNPKNLLIIHEKGYIISQSESFKINIIKNEKLIKNFFDFISIEGDLFLELFFAKKYSCKLIDMENLNQSNFKRKMICNTNKYEDILSDNYDDELRNLVLESNYLNKKNQNKNNNKNTDFSQKAIIENDEKSAILENKTEKKNTISDNIQIKSINNSFYSNKFLKNNQYNFLKDESSNSRNKVNSDLKFIEVKIEEIFKYNVLQDEKENYLDYNIIKILLEDILFFQETFYFILNFEKININRKSYDIDNIISNQIYPTKSTNDLKVIMNHENTLSSSIKISSIESISNFSNGECEKKNISKLMKNNNLSYVNLKKKLTAKKIQISIYLINLFLIIIGIIFIIVLSRLEIKFNSIFENGYYNLRKINIRFNTQISNFLSYYYVNTDNLEVDNTNESIFNSKETIHQIIKIQNDVIHNIYKDFLFFLSYFDKDSKIILKLEEKVNFYEISKIEKSYEIRSSSFLYFLNIYYSNFLIMENFFNYNNTLNNLYINNINDTLNDFDYSSLFVYINYFSVLDKKFADINLFFLDFLNEEINYISDLILYYNIFIICIDILILVILIIYIKIFYIKQINIFNFLGNIHKDHLEYLHKKFNLLIESSSFLVSPKKVLSNLNLIKKKIIEPNNKICKKIEGNLKSDDSKNQNTLKNNKESESNLIKDTSGNNLNSTITEKRYINELTHLSLKENAKMKDDSSKNSLLLNNLKHMKNQIKSVLIKNFLKSFVIIIFLNLLCFICTFLIFKNNFDLIKSMIDLTNSLYNDQIFFNDGYILFKLGYISKLNPELAKDYVQINLRNENGFVKFSTTDETVRKDTYLNKFEQIYKHMIRSVDKKIILAAKNPIFKNMVGDKNSDSPETFCSFSIDKNDIILSKLENSEIIMREILSECQSLIKDGFTLKTIKISIFNKLRNYFMVLINNTLNHLYLKKKIENSEFKSITNFYSSIIRPYYNKLRDTITAPFLSGQLNFTLYLGIVMFILMVLINFTDLLIINFFVFRRAKSINKNLINLVDILKK